jgi:hypothetical protein
MPIIKSELPSNYFTKAILDFRMTRNWRFPSILGVHVDIVPFAMTFQKASGLRQFSDKIAPFHNSTPNSFV